MKKCVTSLILIIAGSSAALFSQVLSPVIDVCSDSLLQGWIQTAYNSIDDEYLVVWEDYRNPDQCDIYGRRIKADGTAIGSAFAICDYEGSYKFWPHLDFDPVHNRYLVVFEDGRNGNNDVYGCLLNGDGTKIWTDSCEEDTCFAISKHPSSYVYAPTVSFNGTEGKYLVVWADYRNSQYPDVYGQIVANDGTLFPPPYPADFAENFPIANDSETSQNVPVVSYHPLINEWLVVFSDGLGNNSTVMAQRVDSDGEMIQQDGSAGIQKIQLSEISNLHHDWMQPRARFDFEPATHAFGKTNVSERAECLIAWMTKAVTGTGLTANRDIHGQRMVFIPGETAATLGFPSVTGKYFAAFANSGGMLSAEDRSNFPISDASGDKHTCELSYSSQDDEWLAVWGDRRSDNQNTHRVSDIYGQRITRQEDGSIALLSEDRAGVIASTDNFGVAATEAFEGTVNICGLAHSAVRNEFFAAYTVTNASPSSSYTDWNNSMNVQGTRIAGSPSTGISKNAVHPMRFTVQPNYPNPFNPSTTISYTQHQSGLVNIQIFDIKGRLIRSLPAQTRPAGSYSVSWDGQDDTGRGVPSGVYIYKCVFGSEVVSQRMILVR